MSHRRSFRALALVALFAATAVPAPAQPPVLGYDDTPMQPDGKWRVHDIRRPRPTVVAPGSFVPNPPPDDALVLLGAAQDLTQWRGADGGAVSWPISDGVLRTGKGLIRTRAEFSDFQLHVEFATPENVAGASQGRGNSGVFLAGAFEIQVLDSHDNPTYADGQAAAMYGQFPPLVNASRKPGEWQSYDIVFTAPRFDARGTLTAPAVVTVLHNGVIVHHARAFWGGTAHRAIAPYTPAMARGPIMLQDHGNPVRYRNIWLRELTDGATDTPAQSSCASEPLAVQVLGSGGPHAGGSRASAGYLVWRDGKAVIMVDVGGGTFVRFGEAGARLQDLSLVAISHLHPDHVADLPALLWLSELARQQPLPIAGPTGGGVFPSVGTFLTRLFDARSGAFPILGGTMGQAGQGVRLEVITVDAGVGSASKVWSGGDVDVSAIGVPHGTVPAVAYRIRVGDRVIVFGSDQNGSDARFSAFAADADVLVLHLALSQGAPAPIAQVHARPATVGRVAQAARAKRVVLSHLMDAPATVSTREWFSLFDLDRAVAGVRETYSGPVDAASDLQCFPVR